MAKNLRSLVGAVRRDHTRGKDRPVLLVGLDRKRFDTVASVLARRHGWTRSSRKSPVRALTCYSL